MVSISACDAEGEGSNPSGQPLEVLIMNEKKMFKILNRFANANPLASEVDVTISPCGKEFRAKAVYGSVNYNDVVVLAGLIQGAEYFIRWLQSRGYDIVKRKR